jgi:tetratricopeptide (TPR) repeat protein
MPAKRKQRETRTAAVIPGTGLNDRWIVPGLCLGLAAMVWLVFGQTVHHQFINLDDGAYVYKNPQVFRGLTSEGIIWAFTQSHAANWHPLTWLSHMLDCQLYGLSPGGHHLTNVLLHAANAILLFLVLRQMTGSLWRSVFVAALFAIHPLRVESVAWVSERKDLLSGLFFLLSIRAYVRYVHDRSRARYGVLLLFFALGLLCKPMLVTLPAVLLLLDYWPLGRVPSATDSRDKKFQTWRTLVLEKLPLVGLTLASCAATIWAQQTAMQPLTSISLALRAGNALIAGAAYIGNMWWPADLAVFYPLAFRDITASRVILALAVLLGISAVVFVLRRHRYLVTGWLWYLIMLGPVIGIVQVGSQARADRYTYLPEIGLALVVTWAVADLTARWRYHRIFLAACSLIIIGALTFAAHLQASAWKDSDTLWTQALSRTVDNLMAELNLGESAYQKGRTSDAIRRFERALQIDPDRASVHSSLGVALLEKGRADESLAHLQTAIALDSHDADAHYNLGNTFLAMGRMREAVAQYQQALDINPDDTQSMNNMAWILATSADPMIRNGTKAVALAERAVSLTDNKEQRAVATLAAAYAEIGLFPEAVKTAQRALQLVLNEGNNARADAIRSQIARYESGAAFRDRH